MQILALVPGEPGRRATEPRIPRREPMPVAQSRPRIVPDSWEPFIMTRLTIAVEQAGAREGSRSHLMEERATHSLGRGDIFPSLPPKTTYTPWPSRSLLNIFAQQQRGATTVVLRRDESLQ